MRATNTETSWGWVARLLHWAVAALVLLQFGIAGYILTLDDLATRFEVAQVHKSWGTVILAVVLLRLGWRLASRQVPRLRPTMPAWERRLAHGSHAALYVLLVVVPLAGWVYASAAPLQGLMGIENQVFGLFALPDPWPDGDEALADAAWLVHRAGALLLLALILLHVAAALKHHLVDRDDVLARMARLR